ncbi:MAG TPA: hypothetical protein VGD26_03705 [Chitinophagaceae bacterium]
MNRMIRILLCTLFIGLGVTAISQDTLPKFSVRNIGNNRIIIGWVNQIPNVSQISIQRSHDSLRNYKTILSVADPKAIQNGFADSKAPNDHMYYRLFYVIEGGLFYFTEAKQPYLDTARKQTVAITEVKPVEVETQQKPQPFVPSYYVYTNKDGYVYINLPDALKKKYSVKFFEEDDTFLFEIKNIRETALTLDKSNFHHGGWFRFELYNENDLVERHRFYLAKDF